uniref:Glabrous enhancer-binding protein-like DBD domain-containing protein n=1 Tax=Arundo donax TaxID=35708 RepID=A0A0A9CI62_ARUDO
MAPTIPLSLPSCRRRRVTAPITISSSSSGSASEPKVVVILSSSSSPAVVAPSSSVGGGDDDEATSRPKRAACYRCWDVDDELKVLAAIARFRERNLGVLPQISVTFKALGYGSALRRRGVGVNELSQKVYHLKNKFIKTAAMLAADGGGPLRKYRDRELYEISRKVWPDVLEDPAAAQIANAARRRKPTPRGRARVCL